MILLHLPSFCHLSMKKDCNMFPVKRNLNVLRPDVHNPHYYNPDGVNNDNFDERKDPDEDDKYIKREGLDGMRVREMVQKLSKLMYESDNYVEDKANVSVEMVVDAHTAGSS